MQENDFEKQVHQKMGALRLPPSETVWEQVALRLDKKEKRRRWIIWFPLLLAGIALGSYFVINHFGPSSKLKNIQAASNAIAKEPTGSNRSINDPAEKITGIINTDSVTATNNKIKKWNIKRITENASKDLTTDTKGNKNINRISGTSAQNSYQRKATPAGASQSSTYNNRLSVTKKPDDMKLKAIDNSFTSVSNNGRIQQYDLNKSISTYSPENKIAEEQNEGISRELKSVPVNDVTLLKTPVNITLVTIPENTSIKITNNKQYLIKKWQWGMSFLGGRSSFASGNFGKIFSSSTNDALVFSNPNQSGSANPVTPTYTEPSATRASTAFSAGALLKKNLSATFAISFGINYTYYSSSTTIGKKIDSTFQSNVTGNLQLFNQYYRAGSSSYTNKYHYIEVPVILQTRLTGNWKHPLNWDAGFSVSKLISSNALHFDNTTGVYYKDNSLLNKTQFNFITGLPLNLLSGKRFALQAGPQLQYGFNHILARQSSSGKHFVFFGLKANLLFDK